MTYQQFQRMKYYANKLFNAPREGLEKAWERLSCDRTKQDVYRYSHDMSWFRLARERGTVTCGWGQLIAARA